ncbi:MAG: hypothetical protein JSU86_18295 [Phycisphaerales bacterium]|nr:MAG: hypothetical protein JSU86_18295 [Phycisphaerales bacterium]
MSCGDTIARENGATKQQLNLIKTMLCTVCAFESKDMTRSEHGRCAKAAGELAEGGASQDEIAIRAERLGWNFKPSVVANERTHDMASLVKVSGGKTPARAIQFTDPDGQRRTIRLGKVGLEPAREFKRKVEALLSRSITNQPPDAQTSAWVAGLPDKMHAKLA